MVIINLAKNEHFEDAKCEVSHLINTTYIFVTYFFREFLEGPFSSFGQNIKLSRTITN